MSKGNVKSFKVATTLTSERLVYVSAAQTVAYQNTITSLPVGITQDSVADATQGMPVAMAGDISKLYFNDTVAAGGLFTGDASGRGVPFTAVTAPTAYGGIALETVSATGTRADVLIAPGFKNIP